MNEKIIEFLSLYTNSSNALILIVAAMVLVFIINLILSLCAGSTLRRINKVLRREEGEDIIMKIDALPLCGRYGKMWQDYYDAYSAGNTVSLENYLLKSDIFIGKNILKVISRCVALMGFLLTLAITVKIDGLYEAEKFNLLGLLCVLISLEAFFEIFYTFLDSLKKRRMARYLEEFKRLSLQKLPGKYISFEEMHSIERAETTDEELDSIRVGINQLNARMDRQYKFLTKNEDKE